MKQNLCDFPWPYRLRESLRAKKISIRITVNDGLEVVIPKGTSKKIALKFLHDHYDWIKKHESYLKQERMPLPKEPMIFPCLNESWNLCFAESNRLKRCRLRADWKTLHITYPSNGGALGVTLLKSWLKQHASYHLSPYFQALKAELDFNCDKLSWRFQKTVWGTCNERHNISLNAKLLFLPLKLVRYVMIHELCHTHYLSHGSKFWRLVEQFDPYYRLHVQELRLYEKTETSWVSRL